MKALHHTSLAYYPYISPANFANLNNFAPLHLGVPHASDGPYFNGKEDTQYPEISEAYSSLWASFVLTGDPNTFSAKPTVRWEVYNSTSSMELVVRPPARGGIGVEKESQGIRLKHCEWWRDQNRATRLNK